MVMDKGLSIREVEDMLETGGTYIDIVNHNLDMITNLCSKNHDSSLIL